MKKAALFLLTLTFITVSAAFADTPAPTPVDPTAPGWGPSVVANVGAFYLNGNYQLLSGGFDAGAAYTWKHGGNINSAGLYLGPQSSQVNGITRTSMTVLAYVDLFKTSVAQLGLGLGYQFWASGEGLVTPTRNNTFLAAAVKF